MRNDDFGDWFADYLTKNEDLVTSAYAQASSTRAIQVLLAVTARLNRKLIEKAAKEEVILGILDGYVQQARS